MNNKILNIYTDGSSLGNPGPGGWGVVILKNEEFGVKNDLKLGGGDKNTTNNRMELTGAIEALKFVLEKNITKAIIHTDSNYVLNGITSWIINWEKNGWRTAGKKQVLNQDLWQELSNLSKELGEKISWQKVKGHSGDLYNDLADEIATSHAGLAK